MTLTFSLRDLAAYDEELASYVLKGCLLAAYRGNSSEDTVVCAGLKLDADVIVKECKTICPGADIFPNSSRRMEWKRRKGMHN